MTTKRKIILGFVVMAVLQGCIAFLGYTALQNSSGGFNDYRRLARFNIVISDLSTNVYMAAHHVGQFLGSREIADMDHARGALTAAADNTKEALDYSQKLSARTALQGATDNLKSLVLLMDALQKNVLGTSEQYDSVVQPSLRQLQSSLRVMTDQAKAVSNTNALANISETWDALAMFRSAMSRYSETRSQKDEELVKNFLDDMEKALKMLESNLATDEGRKVFASLYKDFATVNIAFAAMGNASRQAEQALKDLNALTAKISEFALSLGKEVADTRSLSGLATVEANDVAQWKMLIMSGIGLFLGIVCALFIISGIVRVLTQLSGFAVAIAKGDCAYQLAVREKGEIGSMVEAMKQIPLTLQRVISEVSGGVSQFQKGHYRARLNPQEYQGVYGDLVSSVNTVAESYTKTLDELPIPIMTANKALDVLFANPASHAAVGGKLVESFLQRGAGGGLAFGATAMEHGKNYSTEAAVNADGKNMYLAITAVPLTSNGVTAGFIEILTDLTEIKAKQAVMMRVASEASEISDRVAAASEELAAQVEQVSRGAEMQRSRVDSTASAMTEMNSTVLEVARSAGYASEQSEASRKKAEDGAELVNKVVGAMNTINNVATTLHGNMRELGKQAESIGGVMNVISDIADQTNLLALNAAIEAARAGDAGRGFAVVADEVRKLAEKTMSATQEVGANITAIQHSTQTNISEVASAVSSISEATSLTDSSGAALQEIVTLASANASVVASIATAAEEQSATSEEINRAIEEISRVVAETTDGMVQSSAAVQDLSRMAQELHRIMEGLK